MLGHLKQVCNHPEMLVQTGLPLDHRSGKLERLISLLQAVPDGDKSLGFTRYTRLDPLVGPLGERLGEGGGVFPRAPGGRAAGGASVVVAGGGGPPGGRWGGCRIGKGPWARAFGAALIPAESDPVGVAGRALVDSVEDLRIEPGLITARVGGCTVTLSAPTIPPRIWSAMVSYARGRGALEQAVRGEVQSEPL